MGYKQQRGNDYEHELGDNVYQATDGLLIPLATGYTSQHGNPADVLIDDGESVHVFETKRTSQDAYSFEYDEDGNDDIYGLVKFCVNYPRPAYPYLGVRFDNRQIAIAKLWVDDFGNTDALLQSAVSTSPIEASVTHSDTVRFYKPDAGDWPTKKLDERDAQHVLDRINYSL